MVSMRLWYRRAFLLLVVALLAGTAAWAAVPNAPSALRATVDPQGVGQPSIVRLMWPSWDHTGSAPIVYFIYRANGEQSDPNLFDSIDAEPAISVNDTGITMQRYSDYVQAGTYSYYIVAVNADGRSAPSNTVLVTATPLAGEINFTTMPPNAVNTPSDSLQSPGIVNQPFVYAAHAEASNGGAITYLLEYGPSGMTVNPSTGLLEWTPTTAGTYYVTISATLTGDNRVRTFQHFSIVVSSCEHPAIVHGQVRDESGNAVAGASVQLFYLAGGSLNTGTDAGGYFSFTVDAGTYLIQVRGDGLVSEWYQDAYESGLAKHIAIDCGDSAYADITVTRRTNVGTFTVSGKVTEKNGNQPVGGAFVSFFGYDINVPDSVKWETEVNSTTITDANGDYSIQLSNQYRWYATVSQFDTLVAPATSYTTQYYNLTNDPTEATVIEPTGDRTGINFELSRLENHTNSLYGVVRDSVGNPVAATVVAYRLTSQGNNATVEAVQSQRVASFRRGYFNFASLPPGTYVLFAMPADRIHIPGYYKHLAEAVLTWQDATQLHVTNQNDPDLHEIILDTRDGVFGRTRLRGAITTNTGRSLKVERTAAGAHPVAGAMVAAVDGNGQVANYAFTDQSGEFEITGLGNGGYTVVVDKIGYGAKSDQVKLTGADESVPMDFHLESLAVSSVPGAPATTELAVYPNPAASQISLRLPGAQGDARVVVTDVRGAVVLSTTLAPAGADTYLLNAEGLSSGIYFIRAQAGSLAAQAAVRVVR